MGITNVTKKGQVTIPKMVREALNLKEKDKVSIRIVGDRAIIEKVPSLMEMQGTVKVPQKARSLSWKEIEKQAHRAHAKKEKIS